MFVQINSSLLEALTNKVVKIESREQFEGLFRQYYANMCAYANNFLIDIEAAEEVVQEVFFKLWTQRESLEITSSISSYLFRAVRNTCLNLIKHVTIRENFKAYNQSQIDHEEVTDVDSMILSELENRIAKAIDQLPAERKKIFIYSRYEGLKYKEIADKMGISIKTVENQMGSALKFLRTELQDYLPWVIVFFGYLLKK